ncbi:response regulator [Acetobacteraceae bacterium ESL0709]|nr:response regulator [Acetobacteraceae bacterium ESL0697]MDF7678559.1 response regulator [Acetobacteraceae bacterium ESL0709]
MTEALVQKGILYPLPDDYRPTILLVDDEEEILVALSDVLEDHYTLLTTTSPAEGLELLAQHPEIVTIISDQRMPGLMGDRFLARANEISDARSILLTGYADLDAVVSALNDGHVQAYIHKPWETDALRTLVAEVSQHCLSQRALRTEQALLRGLMDALPLRLIFSDAQGNAIRSNARDSVFGNRTDEMTHYPPALRQDILEMREETRRKGQSERLVPEMIEGAKGGGRTRWHELSRLSLAWPKDVPQEQAWQVCLDRDVTRRVIVESQLRQAERLESLGTLAGGVAHDFNNLLAAISGSLEMLEDDIGADNERAHNLLSQAQDAVQRGAALTRRLLQFGRSRQDDLQDVPIKQCLADLQDILEQSLRGTGQKCSLRIHPVPEGIPPVLTDPQQLEMALLNLCVNARDAMPHGGRVDIRARLVEHPLNDVPPSCSSRHAVALDISDEGEGIPPEIIDRIFDPFFTTKEVGKGTGLGLSGVYGFITRCHGDIQVQSRGGQGTTMTLYLPITTATPVKAVSIGGRSPTKCDIPPRAVEVPAHGDWECASQKGRFRVLVIDDEEMIRLVVANFLKADGLTVETAGSFEEALELLERGYRPDLAVLDVRMPGHDGPSCARYFRQNFPEMKILFMSGDVAQFDLGGAPLLSKPFTQERLLRAVQEVMEEGSH